MNQLRNSLKPEFYRLNRPIAGRLRNLTGLALEHFSSSSDREFRNYCIQLWINCNIWGSRLWLFG